MEKQDACANSCCGSACDSPVGAVGVASAEPLRHGVTYRIPAMDCAVEEGEIRRALAQVPGIQGLRFSLGARTLRIGGDAIVQAAALAAIRHAGFEVSALAAAKGEAHGHDHASAGGFLLPALGLLLALAAEAISYFAPATLPTQLLGMGVAAAAIWLAGFAVYRKGFAALIRGRLNMNALMSVAVTGAFLIGQWPEAAMVMTLYAIAELIEARAVDRARNAIAGLMTLAPEAAELRQADGTWQRVPAATVDIGAIVRVRPGERLPLDGLVTAGSSAVNQASVTGESIPVDKLPGDAVFAGTINESGTLEFRVTALAGNTTLARIIHAVEEAQAKQAPTQRFVDKFAAIYTPCVFAMALAVAVISPLLFGLDWLEALYKALVLLVIACPCALVISTPVTVVSGLAAAARRGILIKGGVYLENARKLKAIALDKTGTITEGKPRLVLHEAWGAYADQQASVEAIAAALAHASNHPVSRAVAAGLPADGKIAHDLKALPGRGVQAEVDGQVYVLGNHRLIEERGQCSPALEALLEAHEKLGRTATLLAGEAGVMAVFIVADTIKHSSAEAIAELSRLGIASIMLSGDNQATANAIAAQAGIGEARGNLLPEDKLVAIKALQAEHGLVAMTGDGINDAPALAQADIGIAMGAAGTDTAVEAADIVVMNDDLRRIPETVRLSRKTGVVLWQNITLALGIKAVFFFWAIFGEATMWMAVFADMGASLLVVANGLRLLRQQA
jgi:Cd2+/Zn2+-exporting ATPase